MPDISVEEYAKLKDEFDSLKEKYDVLEQRAKDYDTTIAEKDERIKNLNDALYKATFTRTKESNPEPDDSESKDFSTLYLDTLKDMKEKR